MSVLLIFVRLRMSLSFSYNCWCNFFYSSQYFCSCSCSQVRRVKRICSSFGDSEARKAWGSVYYCQEWGQDKSEFSAGGHKMEANNWDILFLGSFILLIFSEVKLYFQMLFESLLIKRKSNRQLLLLLSVTFVVIIKAYSQITINSVRKNNIKTAYSMQNPYLPNSVSIIFTNPASALGLVSPKIACTNSASFSCLLTIAEFMCQHFPDLSPPQFPEKNKIPDEGLSLEERKIKKLYFQPWCDYLNTLIDRSHEHGQIVQEDGVMTLICSISEVYYKEIAELLKTKFEAIGKGQIESLIKLETKDIPKESRLRVGIINFAASQLKNDFYNPKVNLLSLFTGIWFRHGDSWRRYDVLKEKYPTEQEISHTDVFILSGSTYSVNDNNPQVQKTMELLKQGMKNNKKLKLLGLCFGHQVIAKHLGGTVQRRDLYSGVEVINFNKEISQKFPYLSELQKLNNEGFVMFEFHNDYVATLPQQLVNLASSKSCQNQALASKDGRILTFQFHSEYTYGYTQEFEVKIKNYFKQDLYKTDYKLRLEAFEKFGTDRHIESCSIIRAIVRKFMEWKVSS